MSVCGSLHVLLFLVNIESFTIKVCGHHHEDSQHKVMYGGPQLTLVALFDKNARETWILKPTLTGMKDHHIIEGLVRVI